MPDTYASFFTVVELHVYMLSARLMQDRNHGLILRNEIIEAMWNDTHVRIDYLDVRFIILFIYLFKIIILNLHMQTKPV